MYGVSYIFVYHAEQHLFSGLVAVGYSASPLVTGLGARGLFGVRITWRFVFGGLLGLAGVALIFWPEFGKAAGNHDTPLGVLFTVGAVLLSAVGSLAATRNRSHGLPFWPSLGFGMLYGAAVACVRPGARPEFRAAGNLFMVGLPALSCIGRIGADVRLLPDPAGAHRAGPTGSIGVMTPLLALTVSMVFEGFQPDALTFGGAALAMSGNYLMLRRA